MLISMASAKGSPGTTTAAHVLAAVWPRDVRLAELDPAGSDLLYRLRTQTGQPVDPARGLVSLAAAVRRESAAGLDEHLTTVDGGLDILVGLARPDQATAIGAGWAAITRSLRGPIDVIADLGRLTPGAPSLAAALASDRLLLVTRPGVDHYGHLRERLRWIVEETAHRAERPELGIILIAPWKERHEADDLERLVRAHGLDIPVLGVLAHDEAAADSLAGRRLRPLDRTLLVRSARELAGRLADMGEGQ
ncbi:hypothetical protein [Actinomyces sp. MRS3W]|uniref:hypothetical protein n=1 Tax=Actinomyces sp. MRS3W TaxID=2800796 RepID=UPI0028FD50AC|nr:hypothetical protein [Actinomyces sp. MRS3W]MDU0348411.1 hypothetical protein [Actinomyces sp. MRS3W]